VRGDPLRNLARRLEPAAGAAARIEARWLAEAAGADAERLDAMIARRLAGEPVDRIVGRRGFWTLDLAVRPDVLSPRSDTETVVRAALSAARAWPRRVRRILDLGTGSGAILLALLAELPEATGLGIDRSEAAMALARENAERTGLGARARFHIGDWTTGLAETFDIVVSNPPYIPTGALAGLDREVRDHDPPLALDGGADGLDSYRALMPGLRAALAPDGVAALEFGDGQGPAVGALAAAAGLRVMAFHNDLSGLERAITLNRMP
jgi:release factor glutamine methyltransferase